MKGIKQLIVAITVTASLLVAVPTSQATDMVWESNTFDTDTGAWFGYNNTANGQNVQWLNSNLAGGTAGELGGSVTRSTSVSFYARNLDVNIDFNQPMHWRGTFSANSDLLTTWNMSVYIGYFNLNEALSGGLDNFIGWRSREPSTPDGLFRARARIAVQSNLSSDYVLPQSVGIPFDAEWVPNGDGSGTFLGTLGDPGNPYWSWNQAYGATSAGPGFDMFGLWWHESNNDTTVGFDTYFDNLEYLVSVPEPSAISLGLIGLAALLMARRRQALRQS
jgi:hypothetical protein